MSIAALWDVCGHAMYTGQGAAAREILKRILRKINEEEEMAIAYDHLTPIQRAQILATRPDVKKGEKK
ncbi:hypothetical protein LCGC14_1948190 [marine sediment metagenome]|uniref:Uncharacterized protein n=1 Tax=marine sediment metagenome TaxID=412755 RepID=A0A0F9HWJ7_9ZZZZ